MKLRGRFFSPIYAVNKKKQEVRCLMDLIDERGTESVVMAALFPLNHLPRRITNDTGVARRRSRQSRNCGNQSTCACVLCPLK